MQLIKKLYFLYLIKGDLSLNGINNINIFCVNESNVNRILHLY